MRCGGKTTVSTLAGALIIFGVLYLIFHGHGGVSVGSNASLEAYAPVTPEQTRRQHAAEEARRAVAQENELARIREQKAAIYEDALKCLGRGDFSQAVKLFKQVASVDPNYEDLPAKIKFAEDAVQEKATKALFYCVNPKAQYGQFSSYDGGKSAGALLFDECPNEFASYTEACAAAGNKKESCLASALAGVQLALRNFNK